MFELKIWKEKQNDGTYIVRHRAIGFAILIYPLIFIWYVIGILYLRWFHNLPELPRNSKLINPVAISKVDTKISDTKISDTKISDETWHNTVRLSLLHPKSFDNSYSIETKDEEQEFLGEYGCILEKTRDGQIKHIEVWLFDKEDFIRTKTVYFDNSISPEKHDGFSSSVIEKGNVLIRETLFLHLTAEVKAVDYSNYNIQAVEIAITIKRLNTHA